MKRILLVVIIVAAGLVWLNLEPSHRRQIGPSGAWKEVIAATALDGRLYTVDRSGVLSKTDLAGGTPTPLGTPDYAQTLWLGNDGRWLYSIETSGTLYKIHPDTGHWTLVGTPGEWKNTLAAEAVPGTLYTVETSGTLYRTDLVTGRWQALGQPEFGHTQVMLADVEFLYTIEQNGSLYQISPWTGRWSPLGPARAWHDTVAAQILNRRLYTIDRAGRLRQTDLNTGTLRNLGPPEFEQTAFLVAAGGRLYTLDTAGTLYEIAGFEGR